MEKYEIVNQKRFQFDFTDERIRPNNMVGAFHF